MLRQARIEKPLMPLRLFHSRNVTGANIVMALLVVGMFGIFFLGALYLQLVLGYDPLEVGLAFLPGSLLMGVLSLGFTDKINMRFGPRRVLIMGLCLLLVAMLLFARTPVDGNYLVDLFPAMLIFGAGAGVAFPALMMRDVGRDAAGRRARVGPGEHHRTGGRRHRPRPARRALDQRTKALLDDGESAAAALTGGFHLAYLIGAALAVVAIIAAVTILRSEESGGRDERSRGRARHRPAFDTA